MSRGNQGIFLFRHLSTQINKKLSHLHNVFTDTGYADHIIVDARIMINYDSKTSSG